LDVPAPGVGIKDEVPEDMGGVYYREELGIRRAMVRERERRGRARKVPGGQGEVRGSIKGRKEKKASLIKKID